VCVAVLCCQLKFLPVVVGVIQSISAFVCQEKVRQPTLERMLCFDFFAPLYIVFVLFRFFFLGVLFFFLLAVVFLWSGSNSSTAIVV